jgi:F0F1-type ATP synthase membrane subunit b/b'
MAMMDISWPIFVAASALACAVIAAASRWWHGKQLAALAARLSKSERAREYAVQQASQARKQIDKLQRELSESRRPASSAASAAGSSAQRPAPASSPSIPESKAPPLPAHGFADTQPL